MARNGKPTMSLAEVAEMTGLYLTPATAAKVLGCDPQFIRVASQTPKGRELLGFPVIRLGTVTKVPRIPFLRYLGWEGDVKGATA